jgi:hypothetical protein
VDDELRLVLPERAFDGGEVEQVKIRTGECPHLPIRSKLRRGLNEIIANQSVCACDPDRM